jgi:serine protease Do
MIKGKRAYFIVGAVLLAAAVLIFAPGGRSGRLASAEPSPTQTIVIKDEGGFSNAISRVAEAMMPAVVHIDITGTMTQEAPEFPFGNDPFFRRFFGPMQQGPQKVPIRALGSGVIISKDGYIITNNHVVEHAENIQVQLYDGSSQKAKVIGADPNTDLAVIKIDPPKDMKYAIFGDSDGAKVGEWVIAIGSPQGLDWTVTQGIVSATHRTGIGVLGPTGYEDFIQTDASINPGNSGGPLINLNGEVIGINALIVSATQGSVGLGFAIPSNMASNISDALIKSGKVVRGYLGVNIQTVTSEIAKSLKLDKQTKGVIVADLVTGGPADKAGMEQGDVILSYDGRSVEDVNQLRNMVASTKPGETVKVKILRNNAEKELSVKIEDLAKAQKEIKQQAADEVLGVSVEKVTSQIAKQLGLSKPSGVLITAVAPGSPAESAGLERGDVVFRVNNVSVNSTDNFSKLIAEAAKEGGVILLVRDVKTGNVGYLSVPLQ